MCVGVI